MGVPLRRRVAGGGAGTSEGPLAGRLARLGRESRQLLGTSLRLYQIHSATPDTGVLSDLEVLAELVGMGEEEWG